MRVSLDFQEQPSSWPVPKFHGSTSNLGTKKQRCVPLLRGVSLTENTLPVIVVLFHVSDQDIEELSLGIVAGEV